MGWKENHFFYFLLFVDSETMASSAALVDVCGISTGYFMKTLLSPALFSLHSLSYGHIFAFCRGFLS